MIKNFKRRNDMDALRAIAMLLGIAFHIGLAYTGKGWFITDEQHHKLFAWLCDASHGFRMPLFFVISGFFTTMLWQKRGLKKLLTHRFKRIFLPCIAAVLVFGTANRIAVGIAMGGGSKNNETFKEIVKEDSQKLAKKLQDVKPWALELSSHKNKALVLDEPFEFPSHGIGSNLKLGNSNKATKVLFDGKVLRLHSEPLKAFEVSWENFSEGADVTCWYSNGNTERAHKWLVNQDNTLSPVRGKHLVLGWKGSMKLVRKGDKDQLAFKHQPNSVERHNEVQSEVRSETNILENYYQTLRRPLFDSKDLGHMWFLAFLCWLVIIFTICTTLGKKVGLKIPQKLISFPYCLLWLIPLTLLPQSIMHFGGNVFGPDTSLGYLPFPHTLFYYAIFFGFGTMLFGRDGESPKSSKRGWLLLAIALFGLFPSWEPESPNKFLMDLIQVTYTWIMVFSWIDLFRYYFSTESKAMRYISDSSYWMYLAHMPLVFIGQHWARHWQTNAFIKFTILNITIFSFLLLTYHFFVRSTFIGLFLNGRSYPFFKKKDNKNLDLPDIDEDSAVNQS